MSSPFQHPHFHLNLPPCSAYVGEQSKTAGEYHSQDFEWELCVEKGEAAVERQRQEWTIAHAGKTIKNELDTDVMKQQENNVGELGTENNTSIISTSNFGRKLGSTTTNPSTNPKKKIGQGKKGWEAFHRQHAAARFFKEKRYIPLAFPALMEEKEDSSSLFPLHVAEIGCGCGSALLPVLKANPSARATACDVSPTAVELLKRAATREGISLDRLNAFPYDASKTSTPREEIKQQQEEEEEIDTSKKEADGIDGPLAGIDADCCLMIFTLSALWPKDMLCMLRHAYHALRPGGLLLFRDYGLYDMAQIRFPGSQLIDPGDLVYQRLDGTLSSFFSTERMEQLARAAGFEVVECEYVTTLVKNRKKGTEMRRVFVHGVFEKV